MLMRSMDHDESADQLTTSLGKASASVDKISKRVQSTTSSVGMRPLTIRKPGVNDVICARGKVALEWYGNQRFRAMIEASLVEYNEAETKVEKSRIVSYIVDSVRDSSPDGGFIKQVKGRWYEVGDHIAREKCGQGFRDLLHTKYRSSTKAKMRRKKASEGSDYRSTEADFEVSMEESSRKRKARSRAQPTRKSTRMNRKKQRPVSEVSYKEYDDIFDETDDEESGESSEADASMCAAYPSQETTSMRVAVPKDVPSSHPSVNHCVAPISQGGIHTFLLTSSNGEDRKREWVPADASQLDSEISSSFFEDIEAMDEKDSSITLQDQGRALFDMLNFDMHANERSHANCRPSSNAYNGSVFY